MHLSSNEHKRLAGVIGGRQKEERAQLLLQPVQPGLHDSNMDLGSYVHKGKLSWVYFGLQQGGGSTSWLMSAAEHSNMTAQGYECHHRKSAPWEPVPALESSTLHFCYSVYRTTGNREKARFMSLGLM